MAILFPNSSLDPVGARVNVKNNIVQFVNSTTTVNTTASTAAWVDIISASITTLKSGNRILVEYMCNHRNDFAQANWCLVYHRMLVNGPGVTNAQVMYSGHMGSASLYIGYYERQFIYTAATQGTYTFTASCLPYQGTAWLGSYNSGSTNHYIRLYEIGT